MLDGTGRIGQFRRGLVVALRGLLRRAGEALTRGQPGQSMVEYGIIVALIAIVAFAAVQLLGEGINGVFQTILGNLQSVTGNQRT